MHNKESLYQKVCSVENVLTAAHRTLLHGRRYKRAGAGFKFHFEKNIIEVVEQLQNKTYTPGKYEKFFIYEPKQREVLAAPLKDRVVHHAIHDVVEPIIDSKFIYDSYACRKNKGTHKAIVRAQRFLQANDYFIHLDVKKYFPSINHTILRNILKKHFWDKAVIELFDKIIHSSVEEKKETTDLFSSNNEVKGLPIGNLTSQFFANLYLNELDQYIKHELKCRFYIRYMDDFVIFHNNREELNDIRKKIHSFCGNFLQLRLHEKGGVKYHTEGLSFLGFVIYRRHLRLKSVCLTRYLRKYKSMCKELKSGIITQLQFQQSVFCWQSHISQANTVGLKCFLNKKYGIKFKKEEAT